MNITALFCCLEDFAIFYQAAGWLQMLLRGAGLRVALFMLYSVRFKIRKKFNEKRNNISALPWASEKNVLEAQTIW